MLPNRMTGSWITLPTDALRIYFNLCIIKYYHFAQQRHEGEGRCPARRLPVHRRHRHGLPSRMEDRTFVAITAVS